MKEMVEAGHMSIQQVDPAELSPGEFAHFVRRAVDEDGARVVVIDSLNGYLQAMPDERFLTVQMHELLTYLNQQGVVTLLVLAQHGFMGANMGTPVDVSYLADTVLMLRFFEARGEVRRAISVVKKRTGYHENTIREMRMSGGGIAVGEPLRDFQGVLTGVPSYSYDPSAFVEKSGGGNADA
jgi:circadian clock protein KaiC